MMSLYQIDRDENFMVNAMTAHIERRDIESEIMHRNHWVYIQYYFVFNRFWARGHELLRESSLKTSPYQLLTWTDVRKIVVQKWQDSEKNANEEERVVAKRELLSIVKAYNERWRILDAVPMREAFVRHAMQSVAKDTIKDPTTDEEAHSFLTTTTEYASVTSAYDILYRLLVLRPKVDQKLSDADMLLNLEVNVDRKIEEVHPDCPFVPPNDCLCARSVEVLDMNCRYKKEKRYMNPVLIGGLVAIGVGGPCLAVGLAKYEASTQSKTEWVEKQRNASPPDILTLSDSMDIDEPRIRDSDALAAGRRSSLVSAQDCQQRRQQTPEQRQIQPVRTMTADNVKCPGDKFCVFWGKEGVNQAVKNVILQTLQTAPETTPYSFYTHYPMAILNAQLKLSEFTINQKTIESVYQPITQALLDSLAETKKVLNKGIVRAYIGPVTMWYNMDYIPIEGRGDRLMWCLTMDKKENLFPFNMWSFILSAFRDKGVTYPVLFPPNVELSSLMKFPDVEEGFEKNETLAERLFYCLQVDMNNYMFKAMFIACYDASHYKAFRSDIGVQFATPLPERNKNIRKLIPNPKYPSSLQWSMTN